MKRKRNLTIAVVVVLVVGCFAFLEGPRVWTFLITQPEANLQRPNVWAGYGSVVRWRTGPDPTEGQARVLRFGENRGIRHGPFHVAEFVDTGVCLWYIFD